MLFGGLVQVLQKNARFGDDAARVYFLHIVHEAEVHDAATFERHGLAVVAGACAARGDRAVMFKANLKDFNDFGFGPWAYDEVGGDMVEARFQNRRVPEEIARGRFDGDVFLFDVEMRKGGFGGGDVRFHRVSIRWSRSL